MFMERYSDKWIPFQSSVMEMYNVFLSRFDKTMSESQLGLDNPQIGHL